MLALQKMFLATFHIYRVRASLHVHVWTTCFILYFILHEHIPTINCLLLRTDFINLMSTTQLDRSRSPTMPCIHLVILWPAVIGRARTRSTRARARARMYVHTYGIRRVVYVVGAPWRSSFATPKRKISVTSIKIIS